MPYTQLTVALPKDSGGRFFLGPNGKVPAGTTSVDNSNEAIMHTTLVDSNNDYIGNSYGVFIQGVIPYNTPVVGPRPILLGGQGFASAPTAVSGNNAVVAFFDLLGILGVSLRDSAGNRLFLDPTVPGDSTSNASALSRIMSFLSGFNGTTWDRLRTAAFGSDPGAVVGILASHPVLSTGSAFVRQLTASAVADSNTGANSPATMPMWYTGSNWVRARGTSTQGLLVDKNKNALTAGGPSNASVGTTTTSIIGANSGRKGLVIGNLATSATVFLGLGTSAVLNAGIFLWPGQIWVMDEYTFTTQAVNGISSSGTVTVTSQEFQ